MGSPSKSEKTGGRGSGEPEGRRWSERALRAAAAGQSYKNGAVRRDDGEIRNSITLKKGCELKPAEHIAHYGGVPEKVRYGGMRVQCSKRKSVVKLGIHMLHLR